MSGDSFRCRLTTQLFTVAYSAVEIIIATFSVVTVLKIS